MIKLRCCSLYEPALRPHALKSQLHIYGCVWDETIWYVHTAVGERNRVGVAGHTLLLTVVGAGHRRHGVAGVDIVRVDRLPTWRVPGRERRQTEEGENPISPWRHRRGSLECIYENKSKCIILNSGHRVLLDHEQLDVATESLCRSQNVDIFSVIAKDYSLCFMI